MFGCVVAGRLLQTQLTQVDETHAYFELPAAGQINHITVFLLGTVPFPDGFGATVHFFWPGKGFQLLGMLSNEKPSAIFRLRGTFTSPAQSSSAHAAFSSQHQLDPNLTLNPSADVTAILGLSIEPLASIASQLPSGTGASTSTGATVVNAKPQEAVALAERIAKHCYHYVAGYAGSAGPGSAAGAEPMKAIERWYETFMGKVRAGGVGFLESVE